MRLLRPLVLALIVAGGFFYFTTYRQEGMRPAHWFGRPSRVEITEAAGGSPLDSEEQNNIKVYQSNIPSVVNITSRAVTFDFFYGLVPQEGQGSGFIIDKDGHILTNYHVIADAGQVGVTLHNRKTYRATVVGTDRSHDLAVIQIKAPDLTPAVLGDSRNLQVGQKVYAIGNPFGLAGTMTRGIVSSIRSVREPDGMRIDDAIQTDASINRGNSGGPLINTHGDVIGINSAIYTPSGTAAGIGFAIPINTAKLIANDLITEGRVRRAYLGVSTLELTAWLAEALDLPVQEGLLVEQATKGGPAAAAGIHGGDRTVQSGMRRLTIGGDVIVGIDGQKVANQFDMNVLLNRKRPGDSVTVTVYRGAKKVDVSVKLGERDGN
jgi:S1-C subfamily serine protease